MFADDERLVLEQVSQVRVQIARWYVRIWALEYHTLILFFLGEPL